MAKKTAKTTAPPSEETETKSPVVDGGTGAFDETDGETRLERDGVVDRKEPPEYDDKPAPGPEGETKTPDHAQTAPEDHDPTNPQAARTVYLPRLLSDEFGMIESNARMALQTGKLEVDGVEITDSVKKLDMPYDDIAGKEIKLTSEYRSVKFRYDG